MRRRSGNPRSGDAVRVILGPAAELHRGIHGQLILSPPPEVEYCLPDHRHHYLFDGEGTNPFCDFSFGEMIEYAVPSGERLIAHSSRLPVSNRIPWIADMDCLLATLTCGTAFAMGSGGRIPSDRAVVRVRQKTMLAEYLRDDCFGLLFRSDYARKNLLSMIEAETLLSCSERDRLEAKCDVLHPTVPSPREPRPRAPVPTVVFMGRSDSGKGGDVALEVFRRLGAHYGNRIQLVFVGARPAASAVPSCVRFFPVLEREEYLALVSEAQIFLSPTEYESYGFALLEAASLGLALVTSRGPGMEHIAELFEEGRHALFVATLAPFAQKVDEYEGHIRSLLEQPALLLSIQRENAGLFRNGSLAIEKQHQKLVAYYARMSAAAETQVRRGGTSGWVQSGRAARCHQSVVDEAELRRLREVHGRFRGRVLVT